MSKIDIAQENPLYFLAERLSCTVLGDNPETNMS